MNRDSVTKLRLDRRLMRRRGWISPAELEAALGELPDAAAKATTLGDASAEPEGESAAPSPAAE